MSLISKSTLIILGLGRHGYGHHNQVRSQHYLIEKFAWKLSEVGVQEENSTIEESEAEEKDYEKASSEKKQSLKMIC